MSDSFNSNSNVDVDVDVLIAGAGPVGLLLACELRLAGVSVLVLERAPDPQSPLKGLPFGMRGLSIPTLESLYRRGLLAAAMAPDPQAITAGMPGAHWMDQPRRPAGHFAGIPFFHDQIDTSTWPYYVPGPVPTGLATTMRRIETILGERAAALGVAIRRGVEVDGVDMDSVDDMGDSVVVRAGGERFTGRWLVGCDGGRSAVRKLGGFVFSGTEPEFTGYSAIVALDDPDKLAPGRHYTPAGMFTYQKPGIVAMVDFDGGAWHRAGSITRAHVQDVLQRISGTDVEVTGLELATTWTDRACQATAYRKGRVLLAGDAAHIHSPLGGQGLNLGLGDAMNLGWKLGAVIRGHAPRDLLDSYERERHPVGARILEWSRAQVALMRPSPSSRALAAIVRELAGTRDGASYFAQQVWGRTLRYELGTERGSEHALVGRSVPDFALGDGRRCGEYFGDGQGLLLDFGPGRPLETLAHGWRGRIGYVAGAAGDTLGLGLGALLVRPDGIVAWAGGAEPDLEAAAASARRWFGAPA